MQIATPPPGDGVVFACVCVRGMCVCEGVCEGCVCVCVREILLGVSCPASGCGVGPKRKQDPG